MTGYATKNSMFEQEILDSYAAQILDAKYKQVDTNGVATNKKYLKVNQCHDLQHVLAKYKDSLMDLLVSSPPKDPH